MAQFNFGGVMEEVITDEEFPLQKAREVLKDDLVAVLGYGVQGPGQALNMRDNGINVIVGQRENSASWDRLPTVLCRAKRFSHWWKPHRRRPSSSTCYQMQARWPYGHR